MSLYSLVRPVLALALVAGGLPALAQTALKVGGFRTITMLPIEHGVRQGYFKKEGLDVEVLTVNAGPAVISAVASGSVQIGYSAAVPVLFARAQNQPVAIVDALTQESAEADGQWTWLIASEKSGVKSVRELAGRTVAINAMGGACELLLRDHLAKAGVAYDGVKKIVVPFPQMQAALQLGNADAACLVEPFRTNVNVTPAIKGLTVAKGILADLSRPYALDVLFVREDWAGGNADTLRRFNRGLARALDDYRRNPALLRQQMADDFKLGPATVSLMQSNLRFGDLTASPAQIQPLLDGLARHGMLKNPPTAQAAVLSLP
ncbi:MAG: ABC transporter substrate-binding protein [Pseudacidovorax sp.]|nr:ABC transporter substrate-binding protein [Pseudacidovorax sp.]